MNKIVTCVSLVLVSWVVAAPEAAAQAAFQVPGTGCPGDPGASCTPLQAGQPYVLSTNAFAGNIVQLGILTVGPQTLLPGIAVPGGFMCVGGCVWAGVPWAVYQGPPPVTIAGIMPLWLAGWTFRVQASGFSFAAQCWQLSTACQYTVLP